MKYPLLFLCLALSACSPKNAVNTTFICVNPAMSLQGIQVESSDPNVKIYSNRIVFTTEAGAKVTLPRSLCMEIERAAE